MSKGISTARRAVVAVLLGGVLAGCQTKLPAEDLLAGAEAQARRSNRAVFAIFQASW